MYELTRQDVVLDRSRVCRLMACTKKLRHAQRLPPPAGRGAGGYFWTGKQIVSLLLPEDLSLGRARDAGEGDAVGWKDESLAAIIRKGRLLCGRLSKTELGSASRSIVDVLCREHGGHAAIAFISDVQRLANTFLTMHDHSVGIHDVILPSDGHRRVCERLQKATSLCEEIQRTARGAPSSMRDSAERGILRILSKTLLQTGGIVDECLDPDNGIRRMVSCKSKGSFVNLSQICGALGQQSLVGQRLSGGQQGRLLSCFAKEDDGLLSKGMVYNSFSLGLSPPELFCHAVGGREGLVDTAVKTSQTGYLQRRLNKSMEDVCVHEDGTLCDAMESIISFRWGCDGMDPVHVERVPLEALRLTEAQVREEYGSVWRTDARSARGRARVRCTCSTSPSTRASSSRSTRRSARARTRRSRRMENATPEDNAENATPEEVAAG